MKNSCKNKINLWAEWLYEWFHVRCPIMKLLRPKFCMTWNTEILFITAAAIAHKISDHHRQIKSDPFKTCKKLQWVPRWCWWSSRGRSCGWAEPSWPSLQSGQRRRCQSGSRSAPMLWLYSLQHIPGNGKGDWVVGNTRATKNSADFKMERHTHTYHDISFLFSVTQLWVHPVHQILYLVPIEKYEKNKKEEVHNTKT